MTLNSASEPFDPYLNPRIKDPCVVYCIRVHEWFTKNRSLLAKESGSFGEKQSRHRHVFLTLFCVLVLVSVGACDGVVVIEGAAESATGGALDDCEAVLFRADGYELDRRAIDPDFSATFTVMPGEGEYFAEVTCEGHSVYRSNSFSSEARLGDSPAQLGKIVLEPVHDSGSSPPQGPAP